MPDFVKNARAESEKRMGIAGDFASSAQTIPDQLKKTVQEALDYNKDVIDYRSSALGDYLAAPAQAESRFGTQTFETGPQAGQANSNFIFNPFERNEAIANYIRNQEVPFLTANTLLGFREGQTADIVDAGTRAFSAQSTAAKYASEAARQAYEDALNEFKTGEELRLKGQDSGGLDLAGILALIAGLKGGGDSGTGLSLDDIVEEDMTPTGQRTPNPNYNWQNAIFGEPEFITPKIPENLTAKTVSPTNSARAKLDLKYGLGERSASARPR